MSVSEFFSEFLKLIHSYGDVIVIDSHNFNDGRLKFNCHIMSPARMADLMYICYATNTSSSVCSNDFSDLGESSEDSFKRLIWSFRFKPDNEHMELNGEIMPMTLFDFYSMVLRDAENKKLINEQEITHFESYLKKVSLKLKG